MALPAVSERSLLQSSDKGLGRVRTVKDILTVVASVHNMVKRSLVLHPELPSHAIDLPIKRDHDKPKSTLLALTPYRACSRILTGNVHEASLQVENHGASGNYP
jgi:hypothetical protein